MIQQPIYINLSHKKVYAKSVFAFEEQTKTYAYNAKAFKMEEKVPGNISYIHIFKVHEVECICDRLTTIM